MIDEKGNLSKESRSIPANSAPRRRGRAMVAEKRDSATTIQALCWKNWLVARKNKRWNLVSILVPIAFASLLALLAQTIKVRLPRPALLRRRRRRRRCLSVGR